MSYFYNKLAINKKLILFQSYGGRSYSCSPKAIYEAALSDPEYSDFNFVWVFNSPEKYRFLEKSARTKVIKRRSLSYYKNLATAGYWVINSLLSPTVKKRDGQIMLQCWHGTPLKRLRADIVPGTKNATNTLDDFKEKNMIDVPRFDYFLSPSRYATEKFKSAFQIDMYNSNCKIIEAGYPRNDALINYSKKDIIRLKKRYNLPTNKKVILYAPTWRDNQYSIKNGFEYQPDIDFDKLKKDFSDEYIVILRLHYYIANSISIKNHEGFLFNLSDVDDINDLYIVSDVLLTDYSSVFFDYANLCRPIIFYMTDKELYKNELRGLYMDINELPGRVCENQKSLTYELMNIEKRSIIYTEFNNKYNPKDDGKSSWRVLREVIKQ